MQSITLEADRLRIIPRKGLCQRNKNGLWEIVERQADANACLETAREKYGIPLEAWREVEYSINDTMECCAQEAIDFAREHYGITLDLTAESMDLVDMVLARAQKENARSRSWRRKRAKPALDEAWLMNTVGGYVGEVIRRHFGGGEWRINTERFPGQEIITLRVGETDMYPPIKVYKRLKNGRQDSIYHYFQSLKKLAARDQL